MTAQQEMFEAVRLEDKESLLRALANGAEPNSQDQGLTPLMMAALRDDVTTMRILLENGAEIDAHLEPKQMPPGSAYNVVRGHASGFKYSHYEVPTALNLALASGSSRAARFLLEAGAPPSGSRSDKAPPIVVAVREGNDQIVQALLKAGVSPDSGYENSILFEAVTQGAQTILEILVEAGAALNEPLGECPLPPLHLAVEQGDKKIVACLLEAGADPLVATEQGTAMDLAKGDIRTMLQSWKGSAENAAG